MTCVESFTSTPGSYINANGGAAGVIGFGADCGPPGSNQQYPKLTVYNGFE